MGLSCILEFQHLSLQCETCFSNGIHETVQNIRAVIWSLESLPFLDILHYFYITHSNVWLNSILQNLTLSHLHVTDDLPPTVSLQNSTHRSCNQISCCQLPLVLSNE